jgi:hypothetical protein
MDAHTDTQEATAAAREAARGLRCCELAACGAREVHIKHFKRCSACKAVVYCSCAHQAADWVRHKLECKVAQPHAAAGPSDAA